MKPCFKCGRRLPVDQFYRDPRMADGRLGKCKDCTRRDVATNRSRKLESYRAYDRSRGRSRGAQPVKPRSTNRKAVYSAVKWALARGVLVRGPCEACGEPDTEAHHDDYSKPLAVRWLCKGCHEAEHHRVAL